MIAVTERTKTRAVLAYIAVTVLLVGALLYGSVNTEATIKVGFADMADQAFSESQTAYKLAQKPGNAYLTLQANDALDEVVFARSAMANGNPGAAFKHLKRSFENSHAVFRVLQATPAR